MSLQAFVISLGLVQILYAVDDDLERRKPLGQFLLDFFWWGAQLRVEICAIWASLQRNL